MRPVASAGALLLVVWLALSPGTAHVQDEQALLWSQRYQSEYAAPEMFSTANVSQIIWEAFEREGWPISYGAAMRLARCESSLNPQAEGPGGAVGLYQFVPDTWARFAEPAGFGGRSRYDAEASAGVAAWLMARPELGGTTHWRFGCTWAF